MRVNGFVFGSAVDGWGVRNVVFAQGCRHRCEGCHNPQTHDFSGGKSIPEKNVAETLVSRWTHGGKPAITISGGDALYQPSCLLELVRILKVHYGADIWLYTGFLWEQLTSRYEMLRRVDVLVDGPFVKSLRTLERPFVGSSNQRVIDCRRSLEEGKVVLWEPPREKAEEILRGVV